MLKDYYLKKLGVDKLPKFIIPYLEVPSLGRLKYIGYFCGMDYASKDIYDFGEYVTRFDHSLSTALLTYRLTEDKIATLAALFHDVATPCFSHVIDYMNEDYENQESTEEFTDYIIRRDKKLKSLLDKDNIDIEDIINYKNYPIVDNKRPKLCADRIDGIVLTGSYWTKDITKTDIDNIIDDLTIYTNEENELEIGFKSKDVATRVIEINKTINEYCHSNEDNFMMDLLAKITKYAILKKVIMLDSLYVLAEGDIMTLFEYSNDKDLKRMINTFKTIKKEDIPLINIDNVKIRDINPLVDGKRINIEKKKVLK